MRSAGYSVVNLWLSLVLATCLDLIRLPPEFVVFRPEFLAVIVIYWSLFVPSRVGVCSAWLVGLWIDAVHGDWLGIHATSFALMSYCVYLLYQRLRAFPVWQQAAVVGLLVAVQLVSARTLLGLVGRSVTESFSYYWPAFTSALIWPWCVNLLHRWRRT